VRFDRNVEPLDETVRVDVEKVKGGVVSACAKIQKQSAKFGNAKAPVDAQPQHDTLAQAAGVPVP
jgi:hypothetical protein